jgi:Rab9 effector protein with kelch motifs
MEIHPLLEAGIVPNNSIWYVLAAAGNAPMMRVGHACVIVGSTAETNGQLYVIGGANPSGAFSDVYVLDLDTFTWIKRDGTGFAGRYEHSAFVVTDEPTRIYVFGGADGDGNRNDVQAYNTIENSWCAVKTSGDSPQPRTFHNGICVGNRFIVYGGGDRGSEPVLDKKVYAFDTRKHRWSVLEVHGDAPKPRHGHAMAAVDSGMSGSNFFDDLHVLDLSRSSWFNVKVKSTKPPARAAHGSFVSGSDLYIFGGMNQNGALDDMFKLDTSLFYFIVCF